MPRPVNSAESSAARSCDEEYLLSPSEARLAATLALMTGFGNGCCAAHRAPMAARVGEQLTNMAHDAHLSADMRQLLLRLAQRWTAVAEATLSAAQTPGQMQAQASSDFPSHPSNWHSSPETLQ